MEEEGDLTIARQRERIDILSSELSQSRVEAAALRAENSSLIDELTASRRRASEGSSGAGGLMRRMSFGSFAGRPAKSSGNFPCGSGKGGGGSMQMLVDANLRLMTENERLQVSAYGLCKSLQTYIKLSKRSRREDQREVEELSRRLEGEPRSSPDPEGEPQDSRPRPGGRSTSTTSSVDPRGGRRTRRRWSASLPRPSRPARRTRCGRRVRWTSSRWRPSSRSGGSSSRP